MVIVKNKRKAILDATLALIAKNGFHGTAVSQIADEAGVSVGIIYRYFESKDELIDEVYRSIKLRSTRAQLANFDQTLPLQIQIQHFVRDLLHYFVRHPTEAAFLEQYTRSPYFRPETDEPLSRAYQPVLEYLQRAQDQRIIKDFPYPVIAALTLDVATSLSQKHATGLVTLTDELVEQIIGASWEAIRL